MQAATHFTKFRPLSSTRRENEVIAYCSRVTEALPELRACRDTYRGRLRNACEAIGGRDPGARFPFGTELFDKDLRLRVNGINSVLGHNDTNPSAPQRSSD